MTSASDSHNPLIDFSERLAKIVETVGNSVVAINGQRSRCSGIYWRDEIIVTSDENIRREQEVTITLSDSEIPATLLGRDRTTDVAVFKASLPLPPAPIVKDCSLKVGHLAIAIGRDQRGLFASQGIVSTVGGSWRSSLGGYIDQFIRLDLNFYPGSGGSALANAAGQVVGFITTGPRRSVLTIPAATVDRAVDRLLATGYIRRGYLGVAMQPINLPEDLVAELSLKTRQGLIVVNVESESPAAQAGILLGDILTQFEDTPVEKLRDIQAFLAPENVGKAIAISVVRAGKLQEISLTVGEHGKRK